VLFGVLQWGKRLNLGREWSWGYLWVPPHPREYAGGVIREWLCTKNVCGLSVSWNIYCVCLLPTRLSMVECFSIISWNVRGLNSPARWEAIRDMVQAHMPKMVCFQETKMETMNQQVAVETPGQSIDGYQVLPATGTRGASCWGGTYILWMHLICY
jgi:hypothetical protein